MISGNSIIEEWTKPAGLMVVFGLIVWGVQLNWGVIKALGDNEKQYQVQQELVEKQGAVSQNVQKSAVLLNLLLEDFHDLERRVIDHQAEAERWKERIRQNTEANGK